MIRYSVHLRDWIFIKGYAFLFFAKNIGKNIAKNVSKNLTSKYSQKLLDNDKGSATHTLKTTSKRVIQKTAEAPGYLIGHKICNKIRKVSKHSQQNISEAVTNKLDEEIPNERYISPEERQKIIYDLRLI